jgi:hypothetical protein
LKRAGVVAYIPGMEIQGWQVYGLVAIGLVFGAWAGVTYGRRNALKDIYKNVPRAREVILMMGLEDPAKPWWKWRRTTYVYVGFAVFMVLLVGFTEGWGLGDAGLPSSSEATAQALPGVRVEVPPPNLR